MDIQNSIETICALVDNHLPLSECNVYYIFFPIIFASDTDFIYDVRYEGYYDRVKSASVQTKVIESLQQKNIVANFYEVREKNYTDSTKKIKAGIVLQLIHGILKTDDSILINPLTLVPQAPNACRLM